MAIKDVINKLMEQGDDFSDAQPFGGTPSSTSKIRDIDFPAFESVAKGREGLVLLGAGGSLQEWIDGIWSHLLGAGIATGEMSDNFSDFYKLTTSGGRTDLVMMFAPNTSLNVGKLAMWKLQFGDASWVSDYVINYADQF